MSQTIADTKHFEIEDGLRERVVLKVIRDQFGYFYLFMNNHIQRFDGTKFETVNSNLLDEQMINLETIDQLVLLKNGRISLYFEASDMDFFIAPKGLQVEGEKLDKKVFSAYSNQTQYHISSTENGFDLAPASSIEKENLKDFQSSEYIKNLATFEDNIFIENQNEEIFIKKSNTNFKPVPYSGYLISNEKNVLIVGDQHIYIWNKNEFVKLHSYPVKEHFVNFIKADQNENFLITLSNRPRFVDAVYVLDRDMKLRDFNSVLVINNLFTDVHSDDFFSKWMMVGVNGVHIINFVKDGIESIYQSQRLVKAGFGNIFTSITINDKNEIRFAKESGEIVSYDDQKYSLGSNLDENVILNFLNNGKMYLHTETNTSYLYNFRYDNQTEIHVIDNASLKSKTYLLPFKMNDFYIESKNKILAGGYTNETNEGLLYEYQLENKQIKEVFKKEEKNIGLVPKLDYTYLMINLSKRYFWIDFKKTNQKVFQMIIFESHLIITNMF